VLDDLAYIKAILKSEGGILNPLHLTNDNQEAIFLIFKLLQSDDIVRVFIDHFCNNQSEDGFTFPSLVIYFGTRLLAALDYSEDVLENSLGEVLV